MILNRLFDPLWLNSDIPLCGAGTAVLQQPLNQGKPYILRAYVNHVALDTIPVPTL